MAVQQNQIFENLTNPYTNEPVKTGSGVSFNQKTYDTPNYMQQKNDLLDDFNRGMTSPKSVNQEALYNIPVVPEFMQDDYNKAYQATTWLNSLNVATEDEIDEWRAKGKMGIAETAQRLKSLKSAKYVPFVGTTADVGYNLDMLRTVNRLKKGEKVSQLEQDLLVDYLRELKEIQVRGTTLPSKTLSAILESIPFFVEFAAGAAAAPETFGGSLSVSAFALSKAAGKKAARKAVDKALKKAAMESVMTGSKKTVSLSAAKQLYKAAYDDMLKSGTVKAVKEVGEKEAAKIALKTTPQNVLAANFGSKPLTYMTLKNTLGGIADRQLSGSMQVTDAGEAVFLEPENMALSIMKSFGSAIFDNYTETLGWAFAPVTSYFAKPVRKLLPKKFFTEFEKLVTSRYGMPAAEALKKYGYDGVIEEMGEELLNRFLCQTFGINGLDDYTFDGFMNNVFYANDPEQWLVEALSFAAMGGAAHGAMGSYSKIKENLEKQKNDKAVKRLTELSNKSIYSPAEYYLEQGLIKINGSQSAAEQELRKKFEEKGIDEETANSYFSTASELQIREQLKKYYDEENQDAGKRRKKAVDFLTNRMLENKSYKNKNAAEKNANLFVTALEKFSETNGISIEELIREEALIIRNQTEADETAPEALQDETYQRSINDRLTALEQEFDNLSEEDFETGKFTELEEEYNNLIELKNQGREFYQSANMAGAEEGESLKAAKEWKEKGTESSYFKKWFGNSKVVDGNNEPIVVYRGTENNFKIFKNLGNSRQIGANAGFFFTDSKKMAKQYGNNTRVLPVYLSLQNPLIVEPNSTIEMFGEEINITDAFDFFTQMDIRKSEQETKEELIKQGYDGIILRDTNVDTPFMEDIHDVYVAFYPEQIKSVNNRGTFNADNPNIYYQRNSKKDYSGQMKFNFDDIIQLNIFQQQQIFQPQTSSGQDIQEEIKEQYTEKNVKEETVNESNSITDAGDFLLGNLKKNKKQYSWDELDNMNDLLRKKYLSKSYIYELPSAESLRKENLSDRTIAFIYFVHSKINSKPAKHYDEKKEHQKIYFDGVHEVMQKTINFAKKNNDLIAEYSRTSARNKKLFDSIFPDYDNKKPYNVFTAYPDLNRKAIIVGGNKLVDALHLGYNTEKEIDKALALLNKEKESKTQSQSDLEGWEKKFAVGESYRGWYIADRKSGMILSNRDLPSKETAEQIAKQMYEYLQKNNSSFTADYKNLRNYIPRRENNQNVKPEALIEVFGFRGINFGNWTKQSERQDFLNLAYDSLYDLAELLNLPPKALSLNGKLGLAFGAQGRSKAAGHFIPEYNEINLTRKSGAGSLAHEWWHALDYYFGDLSQDKDFSGQSALGSSKQGQLRPEIFNALKNLEEQIKYTPLTEKEIEEKSDAIEKGARRHIEYYADDIKKTFAKSKNADKIASFIDNIVKNAETIDTRNDEKLHKEYYDLLDERRRTWENLGKLSNLEYQCRKLQQVKELASVSKKYSKYYENAKLLNSYEKGMGSGYWTSNTELGARAFASYILNKMTEQNYKNNFLVRDEKGEISFNFGAIAKKLQAKENGEEYTGNEKDIIEWYPAEPEERKRIFAAFDDLFNAIQYEKTDRGYKLYQNSFNDFTVEELENIGKFRNFVDKVLNKKLSQKEKRQLLNIGRTPAKLVEAGLPNNDISIGYKIIEKAQDNRNPDHNLSKETISSVLEALHNPIAVIKAEQNKNEKTENNRYSVILDLQNYNGNYVLAAFEAGKNAGKGVVLNDIRSIHSRNSYEPIIDKALNEKRLLKVDRDKIKNLLWGSSDIISEGYKASSDNNLLLTKQPDIISGGAASLLDRIYQKQNNVKFYQSAYHGTPHDFENFSTENIGSGEGAQAHGWGLYFAGDKDVSDNYRKELSKTYGKEIKSTITIDGEEYKRINGAVYIDKTGKKVSNAMNIALRSLVVDETKEEAVKQIQKMLDEGYADNIEEENDFKNAVSILKNAKNIKMNNGQLFKVDIPENDVLLDEDKTFSEQSEKVKQAFKNLLNDEYFTDGSNKFNEYYELKKDLQELIKRDVKGETLYSVLARFSAERASRLLNKYGIKGITYDGRLDGRCYVIFDDKAVKVLEKYYQEEEYQENLFFDNLKPRDLRKVKGSYIPAENLIELFKNADESTIVHEFAHWWLERLVKYSANSEELAADVEAIRKFVKNDGGEFTREQHEKFARGFETYIRSGYAKNNRLKRIFEDFKNALLAIYDSIKQLGFKDDDMPEIQNLFDRLLTTERERIKSTVFDKISEIDNKIEAIKKNEPDEFKELDNFWRENEQLLNRQSDRKRSVQEYLDLAEKMTSRETKEVKEFKKRYKDVTFSILEAATGYDRRFISNPKNWEKVQEKIADADDKITASNGFLPEWSEFYSDTGVSYENDETDGDYKLAEQAFNVMTDGNYNKTFDENYQFEEINKFYSMFDYLSAKIKTLQGEEKQAALEALYELTSKMPAMPDDISANIGERIKEIGDEYEEDEKNAFNRKTLNKAGLIWQLQYKITKKLNDLKVYNPETRYKMRLNKSHRLYKYIKGVNSVNSAKKQIRRINEFIIDDMRTNQRMLLHKEIQRQIHVNSKTVKVGTLTKGKFDWKTNTVFSELVTINKMTREDAEKELGLIIQIKDAEKGESRDSFEENETAEFNKTNDFQDNLKKKFLQYRSMRVQDLDVTHTIQLLQDILELKEKGRQAKSEEDFINKTQKWNTKNNLLDILEVTKNSGVLGRYGANWIAGVGRITSLNGGTLANWESLLNAVFNKDTAQKYSLLQDEAQSEIYARKNMKYFYNRAAEIYGFKKPSGWDKFIDYDYMQPLIKLFQEYDNEKYTYKQQVFSINSPDGYARSDIEISRAQMITMFAWSLNDKLEQRLFSQFGLSQIREMFEERLSDADKELAWALIDTCEQMREDINDVFIRTTGLSLPKVENYFPSKAERVQSDIDMYHDFFVKSSNPSFIKERKVCNRIPMKPMNPLEILIPHINKTAKYVVMSEHVNFLNQIFKDTAIKTKMQEIWGSENGSKIYQVLINKLAACTFTNYSKGTNLVAGALDTLSRNYITSAIGFSPKVTIGQLLSVVNYAENMPSSEWVKGFSDTVAHPVENFKYMLENCEYLQTRLAGNSQNEIISILTSEKDKFRTLRNFMTSNVKWGDIIAITLGGKAYVDYLMKQGMTKEAAFDKFVEDTLRAQQAGTTSSISEWQSAQAKNCLTRMFFAFRNTDIQYERKFVDTVIQLQKGDISKKDAIKKIFIYKILNPFMFTSFLQNLSIVALVRGLFAGDDTDDVAVNFLKSSVEACLLGGLNAYGYAGFIASSVMESIIAAYDKEFKHFEKTVPVMSDFDMQIQKYLKGDLSFADYVDAVAMGTEFAFGLPSSKIVNTAEGLGDIAQGNYGVGAARVAGWGNYTASKAMTGKVPDKKRK